MAVKEIDLILGKRDAGLQDLLLMFLYAEVLGMAGIYLDSKQIPITLPICIATAAFVVNLRPATLPFARQSEAKNSCPAR